MKKKLLRVGFVALSVLVLTACQVGTKEYLSVSFKRRFFCQNFNRFLCLQFL
ncbi:UNVERIFIED_CONTAM: hypothetical protein QE602_08720 [Streptococcus suis]|uniref:hypothetical protein n=1 Tax=Streptococcus suis TaxID=1307 RepID=UPI003B9E5A77